jgi:galactoside O-acetyltransferase
MYNIPGVKTHPQTKIIGVENIDFGRPVIIDDFVLIYAGCRRLKIGNYVHIACHSSLTGGEEIVMEDFSGLSQGVRVLTGTDDFKFWGFGNPTVAEKYRNTTRAPIHIKRFAIVGANAVILPGVTLGEGAAVGAGSVVTKTLDPWGIYIGNRRIGDRDRDGVLSNYEQFLLDHGRVSKAA